MPKKKATETQAEQSERFRAEVEPLVAAGELNATEAEFALDTLVKTDSSKKS
jgi:polyhydroxyalkanoate synthesis regulator phasin